MKLCPSCGKPNHDSAESCIFCSQPMSGKKKEDDFEKQLLNGLDPLDQFLVTKAQSDDLEVEELSSFSGDYDHIEDELEDAQRKAELHRKLQLLRKSKSDPEPGTPVPGGPPADTATKVDAIEALLFGGPDEVAAATPNATPSAPLPPPPSEEPAMRSKLSTQAQALSEAPPGETAEAKKDRLEKLEKYKKYIDEQTAPRVPTVGDNQAQQIIAYLESKISAQAMEIEDLKKQKNELVKEVFSEALEEEHADYEGKIQELQKKLQSAEAKAKDLADKKEASDVKLLKMRDELERYRGGGGGADKEALRKEVAAEYASLLDEQTKEHKAALLKRDAEWQEAFRKKQVEEQEKFETLEQQLQDALTMAASAAGSASGADLDAMREQVAKQSAEITTLREKLAASAERIQGLSSYYKGILGRIGEGVVVDAAEKLFYINSAACNIMGFRPAESETRGLSEIPELALLAEYVHGIRRGESHENVEIAFVVAGVTANAILSAMNIRFVNQDLAVLHLRKPQAEGGGLSLLSDLPAPNLERIQESLFSLRILVELCRSKHGQPDTVLELTEQIFTEINQLLDFVNIEKP